MGNCLDLIYIISYRHPLLLWHGMRTSCEPTADARFRGTSKLSVRDLSAYAVACLNTVARCETRRKDGGETCRENIAEATREEAHYTAIIRCRGRDKGSGNERGGDERNGRRTGANKGVTVSNTK